MKATPSRYVNQLSNVLIGFLMCLTVGFTSNTALAQEGTLDHEATRGWVKTDKATVSNRGSLLYDKSYALLIGASEYEFWPELSYVKTELDDVQEALESQEFEVTRLDDPDSDALEQGIEQFIDDHGYDAENRLLIFFSGHGHSVNDKGFLVPVDAPHGDDTKGFRRTALPMTQVLAWARDIESKHVLFLFDSCFSGTVFSSKSLSSVSEANVRQAMSEPVRQFITAGGEHDEVPAKSVFTPMFVSAIKGEGDFNNDGFVTGSELGLHLSQQVPRFVDQTPQYGKIRDYELSKGDFVFAVPEKPPVIEEPLPAEPVALSPASKTDVVRQSNLDHIELELELELWRSAKQFGKLSDYEAYLREFPTGRFAGIAKNRLKDVRPDTQVIDVRPETQRENTRPNSRITGVQSKVLKLKTTTAQLPENQQIEAVDATVPKPAPVQAVAVIEDAAKPVVRSNPARKPIVQANPTLALKGLPGANREREGTLKAEVDSTTARSKRNNKKPIPYRSDRAAVPESAENSAVRKTRPLSERLDEIRSREDGWIAIETEVDVPVSTPLIEFQPIDTEWKTIEPGIDNESTLRDRVGGHEHEWITID